MEVRAEGREPREGRRITSAVIDYWLHYNESKQFGVILSQVAADTWQQWSARGEDKWITRHLARGRLEFCRGSHVICGEPRKLTGCLRGGTQTTSGTTSAAVARHLRTERQEMKRAAVQILSAALRCLLLITTRIEKNYNIVIKRGNRETSLLSFLQFKPQSQRIRLSWSYFNNTIHKQKIKQSK